MPKMTEKRVGPVVFIKEIEPGRWRASWTDPLTRRHIRRLLPATTFKEAETQARAINSTLAQGRGFGGRLRGSAGHGVSDAIKEAVKHTSASERVRTNYLSYSNAFIQYLMDNAPGVQAWADVSEPILANYLEHCRKQGKAHDTIRQRFLVLKITAGYLCRTYPDDYRNALAGIKIKQVDPPKAELDESEAILDPEQLKGLLDWLHESAPMVHVWATLQGLCGLRVYEAAYLREQDFDPAALTVRVTATSAHKPKTRHSYRTIPICNAVALTLSNWIAGLKVRHPEGYIFLPSRAPKGRREAKSEQARVGVFTMDALKHFWADAVGDARRAGVDPPESFIPRRLRASFVTAMRTAGVDLALLQAYIGHAPSTLLSARYDRIDLDRMKPIAARAERLAHLAGEFAEGENGAKEEGRSRGETR